jgi:threonine dehydrogenase-like Zn-dependent dehydrogenase
MQQGTSRYPRESTTPTRPNGSMRTAVLTAEGFDIRTIERPVMGPDQVLVRVLACGVCSGDVFVYRNRAELAPTHGRLGHEASGIVEKVGREVSGFAIGDRVTTLATPAYSDYVTASPVDLVHLPAEVDPTYALGEPLACCVHAAARFGTQAGDSVAVIGCGFMGLVCLQLARLQGAGLTCAVDLLPDRLAMSRQLGADVAYSPRDMDVATLLETHGPFNLVIEATGAQSAVDLATALVGEHGRLVLVGYHQSSAGIRTVDMQQWNYKAIDVINGHVRRQHEKAAAMKQAIELLQRGQIVTEPLVTIYDLGDARQAFADLTRETGAPYKAVLAMEGHR